MGSVGDLVACNLQDTLALLLDGEEPVGARQNRILNTTVLLEGARETMIPVSCTEQGHWAYTTPDFEPSVSLAPPRIRRRRQQSVTRSLRQSRGSRANQVDVWNGVAHLAAERDVHSAIGAMSVVVASRLSQLDRILNDVPCQEEQYGLIVLNGAHVLGCDVVSLPDVYSVLHRRLLGSYLMDIEPEPGIAQASDPSMEARNFLESATATDEYRFKSIGLGDDFRYVEPKTVGSALVHNGQVIHMSFFSVIPDRAPDHEPGLRSYRSRRDFRRGPSFGNRPAGHGA